ncbi:MAG: fused MFS/spermidine synthase, partial [Planctomycetaceae bacterium]|nr:fused MFS/spermidine synthase [Planctomycetaceae bacterium]
DPQYAGRVSLSYALNTTGAFVGVLSTTFFLLVFVGVRTSSYVAAGMSAACGIAALMSLKGKTAAVHKTVAKSGKQSFTGDGSSCLDSQLFWLFLAAISGFGTLGLEVLYIRMFALVFHNSTYTFGTVVAVFLASLALGAALASRLQRRYQTKSLAGWTACSGALATPISALTFVGLTGLNYYSYGESFWQYIGGVLVLVTLVVAPPITLLGMLLPLAWKATGHSENVGEVVGRLTAINTLAAASGALIASFLLLPWIGLWSSFVLIAMPFAVIGFALLLHNKHLLGAISVMTVFSVLVLITSRSPVEPNNNRTLLGEQLVQRWNSSYGWIDVVRQEQTGSLRVRQNLHYRFGRTGEDAREYRQAHIPLLLHDRPQDVLFLGLGTGLTAGGAIPHREVENIAVVELIPEVIKAARLLEDHNFGVVDHANVQVHVDDARHYLLATERQFDVIVSDLFVPWESESGYLYTVEHYRVARQRLKPGGLFCQWLPVYQMGSREFELIADSFATVFSHTTLWWGEMDAAKPVLALVGTDRRIELDSEQLEQRLAELRSVTNSYDHQLSSGKQFFGNYQGDWTPRNPSWLNTDEHPRIEFLTPVSNRNREMLGGLALLEYFDQVLSQLPFRGAGLHSAVETNSEFRQQRLEWQRFILSGGRN